MTAPLAAPYYAGWLVRALGDAVAEERAARYRARLAVAVAIPVTVVRHKCPHCSRSWAKQPAAEAHIARCWKNPDVRACKTCRRFQPYEAGGCWGDPQCNCPDSPEWCAAGVSLEDGLAVDCPLWRALSDPAAGDQDAVQ
ncbi:hypothetical protein ACFVJK_46825 [Streptomyces sp. NPDC127172]|uniref:hypothetical protein n=1 Tax=Streptomyces sp. NPDC127172 TaxID=3345382 RepID=UPI00363B2AE1